MDFVAVLLIINVIMMDEFFSLDIKIKSLLMALIVGVTMPNAEAMTINFATGQDSSGNIQGTGGALDANWVESGDLTPINPGSSYVVAPGNADWWSGSSDWSGWVANGSNSSWIAPDPGNANNSGQFSISYHFDLTGFNLNTAVFSHLMWGIDDSGYVLLNGHTISTLDFGSRPGNWSALYALTASRSDLVNGINTLTVVDTNGIYRVGARFEGGLQIAPDSPSSPFPVAGPGINTSTVIPEPASLLLLSIGFLGMLLMSLRRSSSSGLLA